MDLLDKTVLLSTFFENYKGKSYSTFLIALKEADNNIIEQLLKTKGKFTTKRLKDIRALITKEINNAYGGLFADLKEEIPDVANLTYGLIAGVTQPKLSKTFLSELIANDRIIQKSKNPDIPDYTFENLLETDSKNHEKALKVVVSNGVSNGDPIDKITRDLEIKSQRYSKANVRTSVNTIVSQTLGDAKVPAYEELQELGVVKGYVYTAVLDLATSRYCINHDGRKYKTIAAVNAALYSHFNCRSIEVALTGKKISDARASQFGQVNGETYETWFKKLPEDVQKSTLTGRQYKAYIDKEFKVESIVDVSKVQSLGMIQSTIEDYI